MPTRTITMGGVRGPVRRIGPGHDNIGHRVCLLGSRSHRGERAEQAAVVGGASGVCGGMWCKGNGVR